MQCDRCGEREATIHEVVIRSGKPTEQHVCEQCAQQIGLTAGPSMPLNELLSKFVEHAQEAFDDDADDDLGEAPSAVTEEDVDGAMGEPDTDDEEDEDGPSGGASFAGGVSGGSAAAGSGAKAGSAGAGSSGAEAGARAPGLACPNCGLPYSEFKQTGLLGCAKCYSAFEPRLGPLIERAHDGGTHHCGKLPKRALAQCESAGGSGIVDLVGSIEDRTRRAAGLREQLRRAIESEQYELAAGIRDELGKLTGEATSANGAGGAEPRGLPGQAATGGAKPKDPGGDQAVGEAGPEGEDS